MHYLKRRTRKNGDAGVSPVVGVMLMLVVTIIIAAVVSGFAGGLVKGKDKAPTISLDAAIVNGGSYGNTYFSLTVTGISQQVPTKDLKLVTTWAKNGTTTVTTTVAGGNATYWVTKCGDKLTKNAPWGYGAGISGGSDNENVGCPGTASQEWGNYSLISGTQIYAYPAGQTGGFIERPINSGSTVAGYGTNGLYAYNIWTYNPSSTDGLNSGVDGMQAILGNGWEALRTGDTVNVRLIYIPTGATIFDKNVVVS